MNSNEINRLFHGDELDSTVHAALDEMLSQSPSDAQLQAAMGRLRTVTATAVSAAEDKTKSRRRYPAMLTAASFLVCVLWLGSQTETWAQFATDFQQASPMHPTEATAEIRDPGTVDSRRPVGPMLRFVLMLHVFGLLAGMCAMLGAWICGIRQWFAILWRKRARSRASWWGQRIHFVALVAYGVGLAFGCAWSKAKLGVAWSWGPNEGLLLIIFGIGAIWYAGNWGPLDGDVVKQVTHEVFVASIAFWLIALLHSLSVIYSATIDAQLHSYGSPSPVPTAIICVLTVNLLIVLASYFWTRWRRGAPSPQNAV